ncbi:MAG TPA: mannosyltransferase [Pseudonocardiaceae bacterium]|nr:mannosyltransferase [Pseudonocardiaceae bacterium]
MTWTVRWLEGRSLRIAPWLLAASVLGHFVLVLTQAKMTMIDLMVYRDASPFLLHGTLYDWRLAQYSQTFALPFTYPPFAAIVFLPLSWLSWAATRWLWQIASVACLWWLVRASLSLIAKDRAASPEFSPVADDVWRRRAMLATAAAIWIEPVRTTLNYGQINLALAAIVLTGMVSARPLRAGLSVGLTAGIKLTPAVSVVYFLATRRWAAAVWSAIAFVGTVVVAYAVSPAQSIRYWFHLIQDPTRIGPPGSAINQSLRGALSRTVGHDVGTGPLWLAAAAISAALLVFALRAALRSRDTLAAIVSVQFFTLLVSPISWSHHWVWVVPALLWLLYGRAAGGRLVIVTAGLWILATGSFLISFLLKAQESIWLIPRPWYFSALGWVYPAIGLLTLITIAVTARPRAAEPAAPKRHPVSASMMPSISSASETSAAVTPPAE